MRALAVMTVLTTFSSCWSQDWIVTDRRGLGSTRFFTRTTNFDGGELTSISGWTLNPAGRTNINLTTSGPVIEIRDVTVTSWADTDGSRECEDDCAPQPGDAVVTLTGRNWPWVYEIEFTNP